MLGNIDSIGNGAFSGCSLDAVFVTQNNNEQIKTYFNQNGISIKLEYIREVDEESFGNNHVETHGGGEGYDLSTIFSPVLLGDNDNDA